MGARPSIFRRPSPPPSVDGSMAPAPPAPLRGGAGGAGAYRGKPDGPRIGPRRAACRALAPRLGLEPWRGAGPQVKAWRIGHVGTLVGPVDGLCIARHGAESPSTPGRVFARGMDASSPPRSSERAGPSSVPPPGGEGPGARAWGGGEAGRWTAQVRVGTDHGDATPKATSSCPPSPTGPGPFGVPGVPVGNAAASPPVARGVGEGALGPFPRPPRAPPPGRGPLGAPRPGGDGGRGPHAAGAPAPSPFGGAGPADPPGAARRFVAEGIKPPLGRAGLGCSGASGCPRG